MPVGCRSGQSSDTRESRRDSCDMCMCPVVRPYLDPLRVASIRVMPPGGSVAWRLSPLAWWVQAIVTCAHGRAQLWIRGRGLKGGKSSFLK